jgi:hypothetical protein
VIGEILADLAERRACRHDLSLFALARFGGRMSALHRDKVALIERGLPGAERRGLGHGVAPRVGEVEVRVNGEDTRDARYWQAGDVRAFW